MRVFSHNFVNLKPPSPSTWCSRPTKTPLVLVFATREWRTTHVSRDRSLFWGFPVRRMGTTKTGCSGHQFPEHWSKKLCLLLLILAVKIVIRPSRPSITRNLLKCDHVTTGGVKVWNGEICKVGGFFSRKRQGAIGGDRSLEQARGFGTCRPTATNKHTRKDSNTTTPKPRQQELQKLSNSATFGEMARRRFARTYFSGAGTYLGKSHPTKASPKFRHGSLKSHFLFYFQFFLLRWTLIDAKCLGMLQPILKKNRKRWCLWSFPLSILPQTVWETLCVRDLATMGPLDASTTAVATCRSRRTQPFVQSIPTAHPVAWIDRIGWAEQELA